MTESPSPLPPLYARWLEEAIGEPIAGEPRATCDDCAMVSKSATAPDQPPPVAFRPDTKCCTYQPELHNFLLGAIAEDADRGLAWAKEMIALRVQKRTGVSPLGIRADAFAGMLYERIVDASPEAFGRMREVRCPYYVQQGGLCGVWRHRNAICSTWFCKYERGAVGHAFWKTVLGLLRIAERAVAMWCAVEVDPGPQAMTALLFLDQRRDAAVRDILDPTSPQAYAELWGRWAGREAELYRECARLAAGLTWNDVRRIAGPELGVLETIVRHNHAARAETTLPSQVRSGEALIQLHPTKPGVVRASTRQLAYDPLELPAEVIPLLPALVGRDPVEALAALHASGRGAMLDDTLLRKLIDYGVLAPGAVT